MLAPLSITPSARAEKPKHETPRNLELTYFNVQIGFEIRCTETKIIVYAIEGAALL